MQPVKYQFKDIEFEHHIKGNIRHTYIHVHNSDLVVLKSPPISEKEVFNTIQKQLKWIQKQLEKVKEAPYIQPQNNTFLYFGKPYQYKIEPALFDDCEVQFKRFQFYIKTAKKRPSKKSIMNAMDEFYYLKAHEKLLPQLHYWSHLMGLFPLAIIIKKQKSRWGSCTAKGKLYLNYQMIKLPHDCIELILVHELAHLRYHDHSKAFWNLVGEYIPDYKQRRKHLKDFSVRYQEFF